jgi:tetratricopeptide (TPR) repeat protein
MAKKEMKKLKKAGQKMASSLVAHAEQATADYESALGFLHKRQYSDAAKHFEAILAAYPQEREIADRCRIYIDVCRRNETEKVHPLKHQDDYFYQGILESNRQHYDEALKHLDRALKMGPKDDRVVYLVASTLALKGEKDQALTSLREAIELNSVNRIHAQQDPDFDLLREEGDFLDLVSPAKV